MARQTDEATDESTAASAPPYRNPYDADSRVTESKRQSGYYGIMYAGEYEWDNVRCTREAYGEYDKSAHPAERRKTIDGQPRRSLSFHTTWMDVEQAVVCIYEVGDYNGFSPGAVSAALEAMPDDTRVVVGREGSPVIYLWTDAPSVAFDRLRAIQPVSQAKTDAPAGPGARPPDELGGLQEGVDAKGYPWRVVGDDLPDLEEGVPTLIRAWWD